MFFVLGIVVFCGNNIRKYVRKAFIELPLDSFLLDIGKSLLKSLRETGVIDRSQSVDNVRVVEDGSGYYDVYIDYATKQDSALFSQSLKEVLSPVTEQRYLVSRSTDDIKIGFYSPVWWTIRKAFKLIKQEEISYHPVPTVLSVNKERAEQFAQNWKQYVGGGELVYTRSTEGRELLLQLRKISRIKIKKINYEIWK